MAAGTVVRTFPLKQLAMNSDSVETNVARASTKVSRDVVVRSGFATKARLPSAARAQ